MFVQIFTEHQGHLLIKFAAALVTISGGLFLFEFFNKKRSKPKSNEPEIQNFDEQAKRKNKTRWRKHDKKR